MDNTETKIPEELYFPKTVNHRVWEYYLNRRLSHDERFILENYRAEKYMNHMMDGLFEQCTKKQIYFVPMLTSLDGNCLFESLIYHQIGSSVIQLRRSLSLIMYMYKSYKGFLPNNELSLEELFDNTNEIEYVVCKKKQGDEVTKEFYKYTYNVMCQDISNNHSWSRLPTEIILMVLSYIYKLEFIIIGSTSDYINKVNMYENNTNVIDLKKIYLGHLGESHYVPIDILNEDEELEPLYYNEAKNALLDWGYDMEKKKIDKYLSQLADTDSEKSNTFINVNTLNTDDNAEKYTVEF